MGYSTQAIDVISAKKAAWRGRVVSASDSSAFYSDEWRWHVVSADISTDRHKGYKVITFWLKGGSFVDVEVPSSLDSLAARQG